MPKNNPMGYFKQPKKKKKKKVSKKK